MKPDAVKVQALLRDTVTTMCKNGLPFDCELRVQGLIGITLDTNDVYLVQLDETFPGDENKVNQTKPCELLLDCLNDSSKHNSCHKPYIHNSDVLKSSTFRQTRNSCVSSIETENSTMDSNYGDVSSTQQDQLHSLPMVDVDSKNLLDLTFKKVSMHGASSQSDASSVGSQSRRRKRTRPVQHRPNAECSSTSDEELNESVLETVQVKDSYCGSDFSDAQVNNKSTSSLVNNASVDMRVLMVKQSKIIQHNLTDDNLEKEADSLHHSESDDMNTNLENATVSICTSKIWSPANHIQSQMQYSTSREAPTFSSGHYIPVVDIPASFPQSSYEQQAISNSLQPSKTEIVMHPHNPSLVNTQQIASKTASERSVEDQKADYDEYEEVSQSSHKLYQCKHPGCSRTFVHSRNLRQHETKAHGRIPPTIRRSIQSLNKPHSCPINGCSKKFFHVQSIRRHINLCHHNEYSESTLEEFDQENLQLPYAMQLNK